MKRTAEIICTIATIATTVVVVATIPLWVWATVKIALAIILED